MVPSRILPVPARVPCRLARALRPFHRRVGRRSRADLLFVADVDTPCDLRFVRSGLRRACRQDGDCGNGGGHPQARERRYARQDAGGTSPFRVVARDNPEPLHHPAPPREEPSPAETRGRRERGQVAQLLLLDNQPRHKNAPQRHRRIFRDDEVGLQDRGRAPTGG